MLVNRSTNPDLARPTHSKPLTDREYFIVCKAGLALSPPGASKSTSAPRPRSSSTARVLPTPAHAQKSRSSPSWGSLRSATGERGRLYPRVSASHRWVDREPASAKRSWAALTICAAQRGVSASAFGKCRLKLDQPWSSRSPPRRSATPGISARVAVVAETSPLPSGPTLPRRAVLAADRPADLRHSAIARATV